MVKDKKKLILTKEEKIIINTGLGLMLQMVLHKDESLKYYLFKHPRMELLTLDSIMKLHQKFKIDLYEEKEIK